MFDNFDLLLGIYHQYYLKKFIEKLEFSALAEDQELMSAYQEIKDITESLPQDNIDRMEQEIRRVRTLGNLQLLREWEELSIHLGFIPHYNGECITQILGRELYRRGMDPQRKLILKTREDTDKNKIWVEHPADLQAKSDDELLAQWSAYHDTLHILYHFREEDRQEMYHLECELERRGIRREEMLPRSNAVSAVGA
jgi:hypothetical protein